MKFKPAFGFVLLALAWGAQAACPTTPGRFVANGAEVTDSQTGLVWARCSVGQSWSGSACTDTGGFLSYSLEQALALSQAVAGWRLPNVKELTSIADKGCRNPAIDSTAFPNTANTWYWASSPYVGSASLAWNVNFNTGAVSQGYFGYTMMVRLVRSSL